jgi:hypothetical protein
MAITATIARRSPIQTDIAGMTVEEHPAGVFASIQSVPSKLSSVIVSSFSVIIAQFRKRNRFHFYGHDSSLAFNFHNLFDRLANTIEKTRNP